MRRHLSLASAFAAVSFLAACGGSSGGDSAPAPAPGPATPSQITLTGVVAKGAALANATVTAKCAAGTGSVATNASGAYTLTIASGTLPCVLEATASDNSLTLHSVATGSASTGSATANITTLTELLVANLSQQDPAAYMAGLNTGTLSTTVTASNVSAAQTAVITTLNNAGIDTTALTNLVTGTLVAANGSTTGNGYDTVLDALATALTTAGTTLPELTTTVATSAAGSTTTTVSDAPSLPADLLLKPQAATCAALRSTTYVAVKASPSTSAANEELSSLERFSFDAATLTETDSDGSTTPWTAVAGTPCQFTAGDAANPHVVQVAPSGVIVARSYDTDLGAYRLVVAVPEQTHAVADLAGTFNTLGWVSSGSTFVADSGIATIAADGKVTSALCFGGAINTPTASCAADAGPFPAISLNANGGFNLTSTDSTDPWSDRLVAYRAGNGDLMVLDLSPSGDLLVWTKQRTLNLPTVDNVSTIWNFNIGSTLAVDALAGNVHTIVSTDATAGTFTRQTKSVGSSVLHEQTLAINNPRDGMNHRIAATVTASDGTTSVNVREMFALKLRGMGITAFYLPNTSGSGNNSRFGLSVQQ